MIQPGYICIVSTEKMEKIDALITKLDKAKND